MQPELTEVISLLASYTYDPYGYTLACFPWGEGELKSSAGPRAWQKDVLTTIRDHLKNPETRYVPLKNRHR